MKQRRMDVDDFIMHIPVGKANAISRKELSVIMGMADRTVRKKIAKARSEGYLIMNRQDGKGYYLIDDINEIAKQYVQERGRALTILAQLKSMEKVLKNSGRMVGKIVLTEKESDELFADADL